MTHKKIGKSNLSISRLGIGCWSFGGGEYWGEQNQSDVENVVRTALEHGANFFDTARMYNAGKSEESLGKALKGVRDQAVICSKVAPANAYPDTLRSECEATLKALQTDYVDIYMLHWPINTLGVRHFTSDSNVISAPPTAQEAFETLAALQKEGKIREIAVSNFGPQQMEEALQYCPSLAANEVTYNIVSRAAEAEIVPFCQTHDIGVIGSMTIMQGLLSGKYHRPEDVPPHQAHSRHFAQERGGVHSRHYEPGAEKEIFEVLDRLRLIAAETEMSLSQIAIRWVLAKDWMSSCLIGSRNEKQLLENLAAAGTALPADITAEIDRISQCVWDKLGNSADYYENRKDSRIY